MHPFEIQIDARKVDAGSLVLADTDQQRALFGHGARRDHARQNHHEARRPGFMALPPRFGSRRDD